MAEIIVLLALAAPLVLMWWMIRVQRRVREQMRGRRADDARAAAPLGYVDAERGADGLTYGRRMDPAESFGAPDPLAGELDGIKALEGRR
jgi:hypothetical protein